MNILLVKYVVIGIIATAMVLACYFVLSLQNERNSKLSTTEIPYRRSLLGKNFHTKMTDATPTDATPTDATPTDEDNNQYLQFIFDLYQSQQQVLKSKKL